MHFTLMHGMSFWKCDRWCIWWGHSSFIYGHNYYMSSKMIYYYILWDYHSQIDRVDRKPRRSKLELLCYVENYFTLIKKLLQMITLQFKKEKCFNYIMFIWECNRNMVMLSIVKVCTTMLLRRITCMFPFSMYSFIFAYLLVVTNLSM